jgi:hypothetical protein
VALAQQKSDSVVGQDTLFHWETLLIVTTGNSYDIALEKLN